MNALGLKKNEPEALRRLQLGEIGASGYLNLPEEYPPYRAQAHTESSSICPWRKYLIDTKSHVHVHVPPSGTDYRYKKGKVAPELQY